MGALITELKRRNVVRVAIFYVVTAWLILQAGDVLFALLGLPDWTLKLVVGVLILGFPVTLIFAWIFELTPEGIKLERDVDRSQSNTPETGRKLNHATLAVALLAIALVLAQQFIPMDAPATLQDPAQPAPIAEGGPAETEASESTNEDDRPSVAVLPFVDMSPQQDQGYFSDGLADTLMHVLAQVKGLKVAARTSSFAFKGKSMDVGQIAEQLGVATILEGSVQKAGDKIRVIAQLIDAADGSHLWSKNFDRNLEDIFAVQDEIAEEVVKALSVTLLMEEEAALAARYQPTLEAYEQFILGRREMVNRKIENLELAAEHFNAAIELDPNYALAFVNLSDVYGLIAFYGDLETAESIELREPLIERAMELEPLLGEAYASLAQLQGDMGDMSKAEQSFKRAIELAPNYATAYHWYTVDLRRMDRHEEALAMIRKAVDLDPMSPIIRSNVVETLMFLGRIEEAEVGARDNLRLDPSFSNYLLDMGWINTIVGKHDESQRWRDAEVKLDPNRIGGRIRQCGGLLNLADVTGASSCYEELRREFPQSTRVQLAEATGLQFYQGDYSGAAGQARGVMERLQATAPRYKDAATDRAWALALAGDFAGSQAAIVTGYPEFFTGELPEITRDNLNVAGLAAWLLTRSDSVERANRLLERLESWMAARHRIRGGFYGLEDAAAQMVRNQPGKALATIRRAIDEKWRGGWWFYFHHDPRFKPLQGNTEFIAMAAEVESEMLNQLASYKANKDQPLL